MLINKAIIITIFTVIIPLLIQLAFLRYVSYYVEKDIYGEFVILSAFLYGLSQILLSIPGQSFARFYNSAENKIVFINEFRTYLIFINILSVFFFFILFLFYGSRFSLLTYLLLFVLFVLINSYTLNQTIFLISMQRRVYFTLKIFEANAKYLFPLIMFLIFETLESFIGGIVFGYGISFIILLYYLKDIPFKIENNFENCKKYLFFSYAIVFSATFSWSISFSDRYFIDYFLTNEDIAEYSILSQFSGFAQVLGMIFSTYVTPIILKEYERNKKRGLKIFKKYLIYFLLSLALLSFCVFLLPKNLLSIIIKEETIFNQYYYNTFIILFLGVILTVFQTVLSLYFVLLKRLDILAKIFMLAAVINFGLNFFISHYGIIAAAISTFSAYLVLNVFILLWVKVHLDKAALN